MWSFHKSKLSSDLKVKNRKNEKTYNDMFVGKKSSVLRWHLQIAEAVGIESMGNVLHSSLWDLEITTKTATWIQEIWFKLKPQADLTKQDGQKWTKWTEYIKVHAGVIDSLLIETF